MTIPASDLINSIREVAKALSGGQVDYDTPYPRLADYDGVALKDVLEGIEFAPTNNITVPEAQPVINNLLPQLVTNITNRVSCGSCGSGGCACGTTPPALDPGPGGDPPIGYSPPTVGGEEVDLGSTAFDLRKCKVSHILHYALVDAVRKLNDMPYVGTTIEVVTTLLGAAAVVIVGILIASYLAPVLVLGPITIGVSGATGGIAIALMKEGLDLNKLADDLELYEEEFVCAFYNATSATQAVTSYLAVAFDNSFSALNMSALSSFLLADWTMLLFYDKDDHQADVDEAIENYTGPTTCSGCGGSILFPFTSSLEGWEIDSPVVWPGQDETLLSHDGAVLSWDGDIYDGKLYLTTGIPPIAAVAQSPAFSKVVTGSTHFYSEWDCINTTITVRVIFSDGTSRAVFGSGSNNGQSNFDFWLTEDVGKEIVRVRFYIAASAYGARQLSINYVDIREVS